MLGKIIGAVAGARMADRRPGGLKGPGGALLGMGAASLAKRLSPLALVGLAAGGYALKRRRDKEAKRNGAVPKTRSSAT